MMRPRDSCLVVSAILCYIVLIESVARADKHLPENEKILLAGGTFRLGTNDPIIPVDGEGPAITTTVGPFMLDKFEASNREFAAFIEETGYVTDAERFGWSFVHEDLVAPEIRDKIEQAVAEVQWWIPVDGADWRHPEGPGSDVTKRGGGGPDDTDGDRLDHPAVHVSHKDARKFCEWKGGRLPTEAEWEFASRGGKQDRLYAWGNKLMPRGEHRANIWHGQFPYNNTKDDGYWGTAPVYEFGPQNRYGFHSMIGNVWEWVSDKWVVDRVAARAEGASEEDAHATTTDFRGEEVSALEVTKKGGSYMCHDSYCYRYRCAARSHNTEDSTASNLGVRCAYDAEGAEQTGAAEL